MLSHFNKQDYATGIAEVVQAIGAALKTHFPYDAATDKMNYPTKSCLENNS